MMVDDPGFWKELAQMWHAAISNEFSRGLLFGALGGLLAIPAQCISLALRRIPAVVMSDNQRQLITAGICVASGIVLAAANVVDQSHGIHVGMQTAIIVGVYKPTRT